MQFEFGSLTLSLPHELQSFPMSEASKVMEMLLVPKQIDWLIDK